MGVRTPKPPDRGLAAEVGGNGIHGAGRQETAIFLARRRQETAMRAEAVMAPRRPLSRAGPPRPG